MLGHRRLHRRLFKLEPYGLTFQISNMLKNRDGKVQATSYYFYTYKYPN